MRYARCRLGVAAILLALVPALRAQESVRPAPRQAVFSPDGTRLAVVTGEPEEKGTLTVWDADTLRLLWVHRQPRGIPCVAFAPDGKTLAVGGFSAEARLIDSATGQVRATYGGHGKAARSVAFAPDGKTLAVGGYEGSIKLWDVERGAEAKTLRGHRDRVYSVVFSADGKRLLSAGTEAARVWDVAAGKELHVWKHGNFLVHTAIFLPEDRTVLTGGWDGTVRLWDAETGQPRWRLENRGGVDGLAFCPSKNLLAVCGYSRRIELIALDLQEPSERDKKRLEELLARLDDDSYAEREAASRDLLQMGFRAEATLRQAMKESKSAEVRLRCRRLRHQLLTQPQAELIGHGEGVEAVAFAPDGKRLASASHDGTVRLWDVATRKECGRLTPATAAVDGSKSP